MSGFNEESVGSAFRLNYRVSVAVLLTVIVISVLSIYYLGYVSVDKLKISLSVVGGGVAIYTAYYVAATMHMSLERDKKHKSFLVIDKLNQIDYVQILEFIESETKDHKDISSRELYTKIIQNRELYRAVVVLLSYFEDLSIAIQHHYVCERIVYQSLCIFFPRYLVPLLPFIEERADHVNDEKYLIETLKLHKNWQSGRYLSTGEKLAKLV